MSWQGYVDNLMGTKHMTHVGIFGLDGAVWANSAVQGTPLSGDTVKQTIGALLDASKAQAGVTVGTDRYILVRNDPGVMLIMKKGQNGLVAYKSAQCVIIALHDNTVKAETTLTSVGKVIDYLGKHGY